MSIKKNEKITVDGIERYIDAVELFKLSRKYLPKGIAVEYYDKFVNEVIFRIEGLEFDNIDTKGKSIEEYYFLACLCYAEENGFSKFFEEEDDGKIFEYCGAELRTRKGFNRNEFKREDENIMKVYIVIHCSVMEGCPEISCFVFKTEELAKKHFDESVSEIRENDHLMAYEDVVIDEDDKSFTIYREGEYAKDNFSIWIEEQVI